MSVNVNLEEVQAKVDEKAQKARRMSRKMALAMLGMAGLTYDAGKSLVHRADDLFNRAEKRGEELEALLNSRATEVGEQMTEEAKARRAQVEEALSSITEGVGSTGKSVEQKIQSRMSSLKVGSGTVIDTDQIKIEVEVVDAEPWEGYDSLNATEVITNIEEMDHSHLQEVLDYETRNKNRVTIVRELEMRLAVAD